MSWDDFEFGYHWERHLCEETPKGRNARWLTINNTTIRVKDMSERHIHNCLKLDGLLPEWKELFDEELKIRMVEDFEDAN